MSEQSSAFASAGTKYLSEVATILMSEDGPKYYAFTYKSEMELFVQVLRNKMPF